MPKKNIIVIGASAGGVVALVELCKTIPKDFEGYIFVVQHLSPYSPSVLPQILSRAGWLKAVHPLDGEKMEINTIYIAPPDYHLLIEKDKLVVKKGPKENRFRPSIDALFRSAAYTYGSRVIGVVLSGLLDDGTSGLWTVKRMGGVGIVQDPKNAQFPSMPLNVLEFVDVDYKVALNEMGNLLNSITKEEAPESPSLTEEELKMMEIEVNIASQDNSFKTGLFNQGKLTTLTCPECNGSLVKFTEGKIVRFRCHTGHAFSDNALLAEVTKSVEDNLWKAIKSLEEVVMILEDSGRQYEAQGKEKTASLFFQKAKKTTERTQRLRMQIFEQELFSEDLRFADKQNGTV